MRWNKEGSKRPYYMDLVIAPDIIYSYYRKGYINWNTFNKAIDKCNSNKNSIIHRGMFVPSIFDGKSMGKPITDWEKESE